MKNKLVGLSALASAALASMCCIGPLVITGLGLGSLGLAAGLSRYRPAFLALTGIVLAVGFYHAYRRRSVACGDGKCEDRSGSRTMKASLWAVTVAAAALATFPNWSAMILARGNAVVPADAQALTLSITGMDCAACTVGIKKSVEKVPGVYSASVDFDRRQATVLARPSADPGALVKAVEAAGYKATILDGRAHGKS